MLQIYNLRIGVVKCFGGLILISSKEFENKCLRLRFIINNQGNFDTRQFLLITITIDFTKTRILNLVLFITLGMLLSCNDDDAPTTEVNIRVMNTSQVDYQNMVVNASSANGTAIITIVNLNAVQVTDYQSFESAFPYPTTELEIDGETFVRYGLTTGQDELLVDGNYTFEIGANNSQESTQRLSFRLTKD